ncbi:MAG: hypothetical protein ACRETD_03145, partial [Steroidobacteraceae bacterium]
GALTGDYSFPLATNVKGAVGASWVYRGSDYNAFSIVAGQPRQIIASYSTFALRGSVDWDRYSVALHLDNVANKQAYTNITNIGSGNFGVPIQPRTVRLMLDARF